MSSYRRNRVFFSCLVIAFLNLLGISDLLATNGKQEKSAVNDSLKNQINDNWHDADKYSHFTISAFLTAGQMFVLQDRTSFSENRSLTIAITSTALIGIAKEVYDGVSKKGTPSWKDLLADFLGIGLAVAIFKVK